MGAGNITITMAGAGRLGLAADFVRANYQKTFGTTPTGIWPDCLVALAGSYVVGVIAVQFSEGERFEIENHFSFDFSILAHPRSEFVSFGRWASDRPLVGKALALAATEYALRRGRKFSISSAKPGLLRMARLLYKVDFQEHAFPVQAENILPGDVNFFLGRPPPVVYVGNLAEWYNTLKGQVGAGFSFDF